MTIKKVRQIRKDVESKRQEKLRKKWMGAMASVETDGTIGSPFGCQCRSFTHKILGDGCDVCNPETAERYRSENAQDKT